MCHQHSIGMKNTCLGCRRRMERNRALRLLRVDVDPVLIYCNFTPGKKDGFNTEVYEDRQMNVGDDHVLQMLGGQGGVGD